MIDSCDAIIAALNDIIELSEMTSQLEITDVKFGDPGVVVFGEYPYIYVQPQNEVDVKETISARGYDVRNNVIEIGIVIDMADYWDEDVSEISGLRNLVAAAGIVRNQLRSKTNRSLGGIARDVKIPQIQYEPQLRGEAFIGVAKISLVVQRQYQHVA